MLDAYLDIETTGLSSRYHRITVIGVYLDDGVEGRMVQLVGDEATAESLSTVLQCVDTMYTYNGKRFDLPFIEGCLGVNPATLCRHHDLMYDCWRNNLYGGFKAVEAQLGIARELRGIDGAEAVLLWQRYCDHGDESALALLLEYNKEDVINLKVLRQRLGLGSLEPDARL